MVTQPEAVILAATPASGLRAASLDLVPPEELRLAVVLNGGVSLAVWMGGSVLEIDRLAHARRPGNGIYATMLALAGCRARVDVITGTSAGGINGAALALSQVNEDADLSVLREVWAEQGRFETLLRSPVKGSPASLFKGDEHFLPELHAALARLARTTDPRRLADPETAPLDLTIMTTVLRGTETVTVDALGQRLPQAVHGGSFGWSRMPPRSAGTTAPADDPFSYGRIAATAAQMALAARASSSFPVAFEPTFVPVGAPPAHDEDPRAALWPDMAEVASWAGAEGEDRSRFVVDGGVLANTPTKAAMRGIMAMPAHGAVRRVLLLVYPHAPSALEAPPDTAGDAPPLTRTLAGVAGALSAQGSRTFVDEVAAFNEAASARRGTRVDILGQLAADRATGSRPLPALAEDLADRLFVHYRSARRARAARSVAGRVVEGLPSRAWCDAEEAWDLERVRRAAERAHTEGLPGPAGEPGWLPYLPTRLPERGGEVTGEGWDWGDGGALGVVEAANDVLRTLAWVVPGTESAACDAIGRARLAATTAVDALAAVRRAIDERWGDPLLRTLRPDDQYWRMRLAAYAVRMTGTSRDAADSAAERVVATDRERVVEATGDVVTADRREEALRAAIERALGDGAPATGPATRRLSPCAAAGAEPGACGREVGTVVRGVVDALRAHALPVLVAYCRDHPLDGSGGGGVLGGLEELHRWHDLLTPDGVLPRSTDALLTRLLHLEVLSTVLGDGSPTGLSIPVELVQLSAQTQNPSTEFSRTADDKLGGWSLNRFGGFLKRSWRVNDWTWGRVDAATVLARTVLCPARVRRAAHLSGYLASGPPDVLAHDTLEDLVATLFAGTGLADDPRIRALRRRAYRELHETFRTDVAAESLPATMPALAALFAYALHLELVGPELAALVAAVREDEVDGASPRSRGAVFLATEQHLVAGLGGVRDPQDVTPRDRVRALDAFDRAGVGREPLTTEMAGDLLIRSAATAGAVTASVLDAPSSGLERVRPLTRVLRGAMLAVHWLVVGLTSRAAVPRSLALLGLSFGGVLLVASLFGVLPQAWSAPAALLGIGALLAAFGYGALRTGTVLHGVVLLSPLVPLVTFALTPEDPAVVPEGTGAVQAAASAVSATRGGVTLAAVLGVVLGLYLLGSLPQSFGSPWLLLGRLADEYRVPVPADPPRTAMGRLAGGARRRLVGVLRWLPSVLGPVLVVALPIALAAWVATTGAEGIARFVLAHRGALAVGAGVAVLTGTALTFRFGDLLRPLARVVLDDGECTWRFGALVSPVQVTASWAVLYGLGHFGLGLGVAWRWLEPTSPPWLVALCVSALGLGVALCVVLPAVAPLLALRTLERAEHRRDPEARRFVVHDPVAPMDRPQPVVERWTAQRSYAVDLVERGVGYRWLVGDAPGPDGRAPSLRPRGVELLRRLDEDRDLRALTWRRRARRVAWRPLAWWSRRRRR